MSDEGKREWFRIYSAYYRGEPSTIMGMEKLISELQNVQNLSRSEAIKRVFDAGLQILAEDPVFGSVELTQSVAQARLFKVAKIAASRKRELDLIYNTLGPFGIMEAAKNLGIDPTEFLEECRRSRPQQPSRFDQYKRWILSYLVDGEPHDVDTIRASAIEDGILPNVDDHPEGFDKDWQTFKTAASQLGVSGGRRGWWRSGTDDVS